MISKSIKSSFRQRSSLLLVIAFILVTDVAIFLDIPVIRQVLGIVSYILLPGVFILVILRLDRIEFIKKLLLSAGLSLTFLMLAGILINWLYPILGYPTPLSTLSLAISLSVILVLLSVVAYRVNKAVFSTSLRHISLSTDEKAIILLAIVFPLLSLLGTHLVNIRGNNSISIFLLFLIAEYVCFLVFFRRRLNNRVYPAVIFMIGISLLLMVSHRSPYLIGTDSQLEYYFARLTSSNLHWSVLEGHTYSACLSITLLPTICQSTLGINGQLAVKTLYLLIFSLLPVATYVISKKYIGGMAAFLASFFFVGLAGFMLGEISPRTNIAILFWALAIMTLFSDDITSLGKRILFVGFMTGMILSHHTTTYVAFFTLVLTWLGMKGAKIAFPKWKRYTTNMNLANICLCVVVLFLWYGIATGPPLNDVKRVTDDVSVLLLKPAPSMPRLEPGPAERTSVSVQAVLGHGIMQKKIPQKMEFALTWVIFAFIAVGVMATIMRVLRKEFGHEADRAYFSQVDFEPEFVMFTVAVATSLVAFVVVPYVSRYYGTERLGLQAMVVLAPMFVIGGQVISRYIKLPSSWLIVAILIPYFLCTSGLMYQIFGFPRTIALNAEGQNYERFYHHEEENQAARWIANRTDSRESRVQCDWLSMFKLRGLGAISTSRLEFPTYIGHQKVSDAYLYRSTTNIRKGIMYGQRFKEYSLTEYSDLLAGRNKVYDNGGSQIYK